MGTYYGYVDRDIDQQINWQTIGEKVSKSFLDRADEIKKEKSAVKENTRKILSDLSNFDLGVNRNVNTLIIDGATKLSEQMRAIDKLYSQGAITYNDYLQRAQNLKDQATTFSKFPTKWSEISKTRMDQSNKGEIDKATTSVLELYQDNFFNTNKAGLVLSEYGNMYITQKKVGPDGTVTMTNDKNGTLALSDISSMLDTFYIPKFDMEKFGKDLNDIKTKFETTDVKDPTLFEKGKIVTINDLMQNPEFEKALNNSTEAIAIDPYKAPSILIGTIGKTKDGKEYKPVFSEPKSPEEVQVIVNSSGNAQYKLTEEQQNTVKDYLLTAAKARLGHEEKVQYEGQPTDVALERAKFEEQKRKNRKEESKEDNNSIFAGKVIAKASRPQTIQEGRESASNLATLGGWDEATYSDKDGGSYTFVKKGTDGSPTITKTVRLAGKNLNSTIEDFGADVFGQFNDKLNMGIVTSTAKKFADEYTKNSVQARSNKMSGFNKKQ